MTATSRCIGFIVLLCCPFWVLTACAQRYSFHNLNVDNGLIQSQAVCLTQDRAGHLWVGTLGGLSRYDGKSFTNYNIRNGLLSNMVYSLAADSIGNVWIGTRKGLQKFDGSNFVHYEMQRDAPSASTTQQLQILNDTVWWRTSGDIYYVTGGKIKYMVTPAGEGTATAMLAEKGKLWVGRENMLLYLQGNKWDSITIAAKPGEQRPIIISVFRDREGVLWLGTTLGLYQLLGSTIVQYNVNGYALNFFTVRDIVQDRSGALWLATNSGAIRLLKNDLQHYNKHNGLSDNLFRDILRDAEGNIWLASDGQGVFRFSGTLFTGVDESMGLSSAQVMAIAGNNTDSLFFGTYEAGLFTFKDGKVAPMFFPASPAPSITTLCYTRSRKLWIGTRDKGLYIYSKNTFRQYTYPDRHFPSNSIYRIYEDPTGRVWIGFTNGAVMYRDDTFYSVDVNNAQVTSFLALGNDSVLMATEKSGLMLYHAGEVSGFKTRTIVDSTTINCFISKDNELWMGSSDNGIIVYDMVKRSARLINKSSGLRSDFIYNIIADNDGGVWAGTGFGIHRITTAKEGQYKVSFFGKEQGVTGMESNINAVLRLRDGSIWFGTTNGALHYQPHSEVVMPAPSSIVMLSVKLPGESGIDSTWHDSVDHLYGVPYNLRLPYQKNNISFAFQAITLSGAEQVQYRYRLEGIDQPWSEWSNITSVTYSALPPGNYVFHAECAGVGGEAIRSLEYSFEIITPFHKTGWFKLLIVAGCVLIGFVLQALISKSRQRRQKLRARLRTEEQAKVRLRTAEDFHDEVGNKLTRINVLTSVLKNKVTPTPDVTRILDQIEENTGMLYSGTRDILWSLKPSNDNLFEILQRIQDFGGELFQDTDVRFTVSGIEEKFRHYKLPMDMSRNLIMIFKEALNNILKYSKAQQVTLDIDMKRRETLQMVLRDDGTGFDPKSVKKGNGINNMQIRATRLNGRLYLDSRPGKGTIITLTFRVPKNR